MKKQKLIFLYLSIMISILIITLISSQNTITPVNKSAQNTPANYSKAFNNDIIPNFSSQNSTDIDPSTGLPVIVVPVSDFGSKMSDNDQRTAYLKAEWEKILLKSETFAPLVIAMRKSDPIVNFLLGIPFNFSWYFFLTFFIWIALMIYVYRVTELFEIAKKSTHFIVAFLGIAIITLFKIPKSISSPIIALIVLPANIPWWVQYIIASIIILIIFLAIMFSKQLQIIFKAIVEKSIKHSEAFDDNFERNRMKRNNDMMDNFRNDLTR
jgi:hypothetical protein